MTNITPCPDWHVRDLIDHLLDELQQVPHIVVGETINTAETNEEDEALLEDDVDLGLQWQIAADAADFVAAEADPDELAHPSSGDVSNDVYLCQVGTDLLIHAWDLAVAVGIPISFAASPTLAAYGHALSSQSIMQPADGYAVPISVAEKASLQTKLLALYGRSVNWRQAPT